MCPDSCRMPVRLLSDAGVAAASPSLIDEPTDEMAEHLRPLVDRRRRQPPTPAQHEHLNFHGTYNLVTSTRSRNSVAKDTGCCVHQPLELPGHRPGGLLPRGLAALWTDYLTSTEK